MREVAKLPKKSETATPAERSRRPWRSVALVVGISVLLLGLWLGLPLTPPNPSPARYHDNDDGTVTDRETGLQWMRCSVGQQWSGGICDGKATKYSWKVAKYAAEVERFAGYANWRLPSVDELNGLVYCSTGERKGFRFLGHGDMCLGNFEEPTIVQSVFPNTLRGDYWTGSLFAIDGSSVWRVHFASSSAAAYDLHSVYPVRLVRGGQ